MIPSKLQENFVQIQSRGIFFLDTRIINGKWSVNKAVKPTESQYQVSECVVKKGCGYWKYFLGWNEGRKSFENETLFSTFQTKIFVLNYKINIYASVESTSKN